MQPSRDMLASERVVVMADSIGQILTGADGAYCSRSYARQTVEFHAGIPRSGERSYE